MVNLDKWVEVEHEDVKLGDELRIIWTKETENLTTREVHKGHVHRVDGNGDFYMNGTGWEPGDAHKNETAIIYRRKPVPFVFPHNIGAVIEGTPKHNENRPPRRYVRLDGRWVQSNGGTAYEDALACNFVDWKVLSKGVEL
jgi:hypothetical protein